MRDTVHSQGANITQESSTKKTTGCIDRLASARTGVSG
jgi:hypothetical protein